MVHISYPTMLMHNTNKQKEKWQKFVLSKTLWNFVVLIMVHFLDNLMVKPKFISCIDKTVSELEDDWKTYAKLTMAQGHPATKKNIKALLQWTCDEICTRRNSADMVFPIDNVTQLIKRYTTHKQWLKKATDKAKTALPKQFTEQTKWWDWKGSFINLLRTQPGCKGVPLNNNNLYK